MKTTVYVEGGGDSSALHSRCREGFRKLLEKAGFLGKMPTVKSCGSRRAAYDGFCADLMGKGVEPSEFPVLLVDSEAPVESLAWEHLRSRDGWVKPTGAQDDHAHLMVQCMETWILADHKAVKDFFGQGFREGSLPPLNDLEQRSKGAVQESLVNASRDCGPRRKYEKGKRSFELLAQLDPGKLECLPHFSRLIAVLRKKLRPG